MFETLTLPSLDVVMLVARAVLLIGAFCVFALAFIRWRNADARNNAQLQQQLERTFAEVRTLHETVVVMSARIEALSEKSEASTRASPATSVAGPRGYDIAARLAKNGTDADGLIANCGLTRQEAELMVRLHGAKSSEADGAARPAARPEPTRTRPQPQMEPQPQPQVRPAAPRAVQIPVLQVPQPEIRSTGARRRGSLVSAVG